MPLVTGTWTQVDQSVLDAVDAIGRPMHFLKPDSRTQIQALLAQYGSPITGIFISGSGSAPDCIIERHSFPTVKNNQVDQITNQLDSQISAIYLETVGTETDRSFWTATHFWSVVQTKLYTPRLNGAGDFSFYISNDSPPSNWWQGL